MFQVVGSTLIMLYYNDDQYQVYRGIAGVKLLRTWRLMNGFCLCKPPAEQMAADWIIRNLLEAVSWMVVG